MLRHAQLLNLGLICMEDTYTWFGYSNRAGLINTMSITSTSSEVDSTKSWFRGGIGLISNFRNIGRGNKPIQPTVEDSNDHTLQPTHEIVLALGQGDNSNGLPQFEGWRHQGEMEEIGRKHAQNQKKEEASNAELRTAGQEATEEVKTHAFPLTQENIDSTIKAAGSALDQFNVLRQIDMLSTQAVTILVMTLQSKNQNCRQQVARKLRTLVEGGQHLIEFKQAGGIAALLLLLEDPNLNCRQDALVALQALPPSTAIPVAQLPLESILYFLIQKGPNDVMNAAIGLFYLMVKGKAVSADKFLESEGALEAILRLLDTDSDSPGSQKCASALLVMAKENQSIRTRIAEHGLDILVKYVRDLGNNKVKELLTATLVLFCRDGETYQKDVIEADGHRFLITSLQERISKQEAAQGLLELIENTCTIEIVLDCGFVATAIGSIAGRFACIDIVRGLSLISSIQEGLNQIYSDSSSVSALLILLEHCPDLSGKNVAALIISRLYPLLYHEKDSLRRERITEKCQLLLDCLDPFDPDHANGFLQALAALSAEPEGRKRLHQTHGHKTLSAHLSVTDTEIQDLVLKIFSEMSSDVSDSGLETFSAKMIRVAFMDIRVGEQVLNLLKLDEFGRRTESMKHALILIRNLSLAGSYASSELVEEGAVSVLLEVLKRHERFLPIVTELALKALEKVLDDPKGKAAFMKGGGIKTLVAIVKVDCLGRAGDAFERANVATIILIMSARDPHSRRHVTETIFDGDILTALNKIIFDGQPGKIKWHAAVLMKLMAMHGPSRVFVAIKEKHCLDALIFLCCLPDCNAIAMDVLNFVSEKNRACRNYIQDNWCEVSPGQGSMTKMN